MKNGFINTVVFTSLIGACSIANAADLKWYAGAGVGSSSIDTGVSALTGTASLDEDDTGFKLFGGYRLTKNISIEGFYSDFGEASLTGNNGDTFTYGGAVYTFTANNVKVTAEGTALGVAGVFNMPLSKDFSAHAKLGLMHWDADGTVTADAGSAALSDDGTDIYYGLGATYNFTKNIGVAVELERYDFDNEDVDLISANFVYSF